MDEVDIKSYDTLFSQLSIRDRILFNLITAEAALSTADLLLILKINSRMQRSVERQIKNLLQAGFIEIQRVNDNPLTGRPVRYYQVAFPGRKYIGAKIKEIDQRKEQEIERKRREEVRSQLLEYWSSFLQDQDLDMHSDCHVIDFKEITHFSPHLADTLLDEPEESLKYAHLALKEICDADNIEPKDIFITNPPESTRKSIRSVRVMDIGKLVTIEGIIKSITPIDFLLIRARFECPTCGNTMTIEQNEQIVKTPTRCSCGRKGMFRILAREYVDLCTVIIEEAPENLEGKQAERMYARITGTLASHDQVFRRLRLSTKVRIIGHITEVPRNRGRGVETVHDRYLKVNYIDFIDPDLLDLNITKEEEQQIKALSKKKTLYSDVTNSFATAIHGYKEAKLALALQAAGGNVSEDQKYTLHIALVGDPGLAKSQMVQAGVSLVPAGVYITATDVTGPGLTVSFNKDDNLRRFVAEAGAIVQANNGTLGIDEIDKGNMQDIQKLHTPMAQMLVTASKAGLTVTFPARTNVLLAANPINGKFDFTQPLVPQMALPPPLRNRMDLLFPIVDDAADKDRDKRISQTIFSRAKSKVEPTYPLDFIRKYFAYCKINSNPQWKNESQQLAETFYLSIRSFSGHNLIINPRTLESCRLLSEASARLRLSRYVEIDDVKRVIKLMCYCFEKQDPENFTFSYNKFIKEGGKS